MNVMFQFMETYIIREHRQRSHGQTLVRSEIMFKLAPSILSADFARLGEEVKIVEEAGAHYIHIDVMDGHFVPNISIGLPVVKSLRKITDMTLDVHLMIAEPERYIEDFAEMGADIINVHVEACKDAKKIIERIKSLDKRAALTIKPSTPIESVYDYLGELDMVLIMSVEPGFGGQEFNPDALKKASKLSDFIEKNNLLTEIEMDGGIYLSNVNEVLESGVNVIVAGSAVFGSKNPSEAVKSFYSTFRNFKNN